MKKLDLDDDSITYARGVSGIVGPDRVLLEGDDNLIAGTSWETEGFTVAPFLSPASWSRLTAGIASIVRSILADLDQRSETFALEAYHRHVGGRDDLHVEIARRAGRGFPIRDFPGDPREVTERIGELCGVRVTCLEPGTPEGVFNLRIVRPRSRDNNPLHRDVWLDHLRNAVNIYVPIAGSNARSSLSLVPGSHLWKESEIARTEQGARVNNVRFTVPSVVAASRPVNVVRPDPGPNQVLLFSPYLIHGGASNQNADCTRVSLEMRFWRDRA